MNPTWNKNDDDLVTGLEGKMARGELSKAEAESLLSLLSVAGITTEA